MKMWRDGRQVETAGRMEVSPAPTSNTHTHTTIHILGSVLRINDVSISINLCSGRQKAETAGRQVCNYFWPAAGWLCPFPRVLLFKLHYPLLMCPEVQLVRAA